MVGENIFHESNKSKKMLIGGVIRSHTGKVKQVGSYIVSAEIGKGAFGIVYKVESIDSSTELFSTS